MRLRLSSLAARLAVVAVAVAASGCRRHHAPVEVEPEAPAPVAPVEVAPAATADLAFAAPATPTLPPAATGPRMPDGGTLNGDAQGPRAADFNRVVDGALPRVQKCFDGLPAGDYGILVHYIVEPPGYTGGITVSGSAPPAAQECARGIINDLKFPAFKGHKVESDLPFTLKRTEKATRTEIFDAAPAPQQ
ncbi:MAG TPA: hypothetical protein VIA18_19675 [Polyangia bacterium]|jgi:hypothetical protein|nr:hypothetical protein [Polyangia bacterium]